MGGAGLIQTRTDSRSARLLPHTAGLSKKLLRSQALGGAGPTPPAAGRLVPGHAHGQQAPSVQQPCRQGGAQRGRLNSLPAGGHAAARKAHTTAVRRCHDNSQAGSKRRRVCTGDLTALCRGSPGECKRRAAAQCGARLQRRSKARTAGEAKLALTLAGRWLGLRMGHTWGGGVLTTAIGQVKSTMHARGLDGQRSVRGAPHCRF